MLIGESGVGKTGLAIRLAEDRWEITESTHGMNVWQLDLPHPAGPPGIEREVWLWDFAGQPDYRLVHQLSMDDAALALLVFDPQDDNPFEVLGHWDRAIGTSARHQPAKLLVAGRCDRGGLTVSRKKLETYRVERGFAEFVQTAAKSGAGCAALRSAIAQHIPWDRLPWISTSRLFKILKDAIVELKGSATTEGGSPLVRLSELRQRLQILAPAKTFTEGELRAVVGLLAGQGMVKVLDFGEFVLLQPEWLNAYASAVVRAAREHSDEMGAVRELDVLEERIDFKDMARLRPVDERILLRAMIQTFLDRALCLRQETPQGEMLVFPSYFNRDRPVQPHHPNVLVTYGFAGSIDEIYSTLVVRLHYAAAPFELDELWKDAADFRTAAGKRLGLTMTREGEGTAEVAVYFEPDAAPDTQVTFVKYVHEPY